MKANGRRFARIAAHLGLAAMLAAPLTAHALDSFGQQPTGPLAFNPSGTQDTTSPVYLRYDYSAHKRRYHSLDTDHRLLATYDNVGVLLERATLYPQAPTGKLRLDRAAFVVGARDPNGDMLHLGIGRTLLKDAQHDHLDSLLLLASSPVSDNTNFELNLAVPITGLRQSFTKRHSTWREADGEAALAFRTRFAALRVGYRNVAVRDAASTAGWFVGISLYL